MASISSIISLFVLLLATYCYSVPVGIEFDYTTIASEFPDHKQIDERVLESLTFEETTAIPQIHIKRTKDVHTDDESDSYEHTTERLTSSELKHEKIISSDETTPKWVKRSDEINPSTNVLIENPKPIEFNKESEERREEATTSKWVKRSDEIYPSDHVLIAKPKPVEINKESQEKREEETVNFDFTTIEIPSEDSKVERNIDTDLYATVESSTEFNGRASRFVQNEPIVTAFTEPTSSFESFADTTGLLHTRTIPETFEHKNEGKTRITDYFHEDTSFIINQTMHEQHSSSFSEGTMLLLFLLAALLFCTLFLASIIAFVHLKKTIQRSSPITEMEAELDKQYDHLEK